MIAKLEWTQSNAQQNIEQLQNPTMGVQSTTNHQQQNHRLGTDSSQSHWEALMNFTGTKSLPQILLMLKHKTC